MTGPGDAVGAEHAFAHGAKLFHRRLAAAVAKIDAELDAAHAASEGALQHHGLHPAVEAGATQLWAIVSAADFEHLPVRVDAEEARHAGKRVAVEQDERAVGGVGQITVDAAVEAAGPEVVRVDIP